jgi:hypothetical protein
MQKRSSIKTFGDYKVTVIVEGPCRDQVASSHAFISNAAEIKGRELAPEKPKKPCGCSGS